MEIDLEERRRPRPEPRVGSNVLLVDLAKEARALRVESSWETLGKNAKTLIHHDDLRIVLVALAKGAQLHEHSVTRSVSIEVLEGEIRVAVEGVSSPFVLGPRALLMLEGGKGHDVDALNESVFLLTIA